MALRQKQNDQDLPRENFNLNVFHSDEVDLNKSYGQFLESVGKSEGSKILTKEKNNQEQKV